MSDVNKDKVIDDAMKFINAWFDNPNTERPEITIPAREDNTDLSLVNGIKALTTENDRLQSRVAELSGLLLFAIEMTGEPDCYYDHHGYCQAHNLQPKGECWVECARAALKNKDASDD